MLLTTDFQHPHPQFLKCDISQNIFFCNWQKNECHAGLELHEGE